ncbi:uroporphyrinogen-III synthase [Mariprofundus erugo]|uniref:Uroporphyrinogen-III synthase n=1 Tax=Mariprofundus erugo TaxID=2528639 RepID=A0A5R9GWU3_9PROT|nr:uroporphyrinogen-III synthase [Mariprofundus erugo]TLS68663.1 uroporphyrinogen-III synthase [Mariprofundus erugo]TLS77644.1 uroporphyrinogen-III synthase [Mariprofundus erugo]
MSSSPLAGKRILLSRAAAQLPELAGQVSDRGGIPLLFPCLAVEVMHDEITQALSLAGQYSDVVFTSANGVDAVAQAVAGSGQSFSRALAGMRVAAVGARTAIRLQQYGVQPAIVPEEASQDGLIDAYVSSGLPCQLLFFRAEEGRDALVEALAGQGVGVTMVTAYRTVCPDDDASAVQALLRADAVDAVLLGSARAASHYVQRIGSVELASRPVIVVISAAMADAARKLGLRVQLVAKSASFEAMLDALAEYYMPSSPERGV